MASCVVKVTFLHYPHFPRTLHIDLGLTYEACGDVGSRTTCQVDQMINYDHLTAVHKHDIIVYV